IVLLHAGVGMLLASELVTDLTANEARMSIAEGQTASYTYDIRNTELAIVDRTSSEADRVVVVPQSMLADAAYRGTPITHPDLPFDVRVVEFLSNSNLKTSSPKQTNPATAGVGVSTVAVPVRSVNGITAGGGVNLPSAYVEFLDKQSGESSGVYLMSSLLDRPEFDRPGQKVGKYDAALRFKREPKPYSITLNEFRFDRYVGTNTAKNYSSDVRLVDNNRSIDREFRISMNNPLRYAGDTLYQADFDKRTEKTTVLQVVTNRGWMLPYVSLMVVGFGMLAQFAMTLGRFVNRRADEEAKAARKLAKQQAAAAEPGVAEPGIAESSDNEPSNAGWTSPRVWFPVVTALVMGGYLLGKARPPADEPLAMQVHEFGALPLAEGGRVKPYDTLARTTLQFLSARQEVELADGAKLPAITWMLDAITGKPIADSYRVFRLENLDL
ncbi:MAG: cytochrome c biogenesis protein ResB, partial [Planctomycetota bacterium]